MKTDFAALSWARRVSVVFSGVCLLLSVTAVQAQTSRNLFRRVMPSVVIVHVEKKAVVQPASETAAPDPNIGSGALISADGKVLTAASVVRNAERIQVEFFKGTRISARVLSTSAYADVALLQLDRVPENAIIAPLGDSSQTAVGDQVFIIGSSAGIAQSLSVGWISARLANEKTNNAPVPLEMLQLDASLKLGNTGGPVFNVKGEVIGLVSYSLTKANNAARSGLAVTSNVARKLLLEDSGKK